MHVRKTMALAVVGVALLAGCSGSSKPSPSSLEDDRVGAIACAEDITALPGQGGGFETVITGLISVGKMSGADAWELVSNSVGSVCPAYIKDLPDESDYDDIKAGGS